MKQYEVTIKVTVSGSSKDRAKDNALEYFRQIDNIKDSEIKEVKE